MVTIFFNPHTFPVVDILSQDGHFTAQCFIDNVVIQLAQDYSTESGDIARRRLQLHFNNSRCDTATVV
jgi:hypothetical protein